ncbi:hypothetical protein UFOVP1228_12 [uncultured Caudovirales phage]|uniref:Uncharacterized protein n=1 Tax=uncultured Caudovirales phage TaxID=2100421 RepID=A0A6J5SM67_9CAUD|nr:hypothetical protein UFOVP956_12 [uncultured Caudovirales phage]CAB4191167.1 hypothetical protein UFOVP1228_12 [uncultured Caudovirales phage]CAB4215454.1 hypothetical protein UFOVP1481_26 [uncultured Caudovirales phage]
MITASPTRGRFLVSLLQTMRPGHNEHKRVPGAFPTSTKEWQNVFGDDYLEAYNFFLEVVDSSYHHSAGWVNSGKSYSRAVKPRETIKETLDQWLQEDPNLLRRYVKRAGHVVKEITDLVKVAATFSIEGFFQSEYHKDLLQMHVASLDEDGVAFVRMSAASENPDGRIYAKGPSLMYLPSYIREAIVSRQSVIDMKNCHPTALVALASFVDPTKNFETLKSYVSDREMHLKTICGYYGVLRSSSKEIFQSISYGMRLLKGKESTGDMATWIQKSEAVVPVKNGEYVHSEFLKNFSKESRQAGKLLVLHPAFAKYADIQDMQKRISYCLQDVETRLAEITEAVLNEAGHQTTCRIHDGMMVNGRVTAKDIEEIRKACAFFCIQTYGTDLGMDFSKKYIGGN